MKIHILSDSPKVNSGFSIVTKNLSVGLKKLGYDVSCSGLQTSYVSEWWNGIKIYPMASDKPENIQLINNLIEENPDIVLYIGDMYTDVSYLAKIPIGLGKKVVIHCPVEGSRIPNRMIADLKEIVNNGGAIIPQSKYGQREMERYRIDTKNFLYHGFDEKIFKILDFGVKGGKGHDKDYLGYCYYNTEVGKTFTDPETLESTKGSGCNRCNEIYKDIKEKKNCPYYKKEEFIFLKWAKAREDLPEQWTEFVINPKHLLDMFRERFIFIFIGANISFRKRPERLLEAYAKLINGEMGGNRMGGNRMGGNRMGGNRMGGNRMGGSRQIKDRVWLHLHTIPNGTTGFDLLEIANDLGIKNNISFSYGIGRSNNMSDEAINILLNLGDCFVSATSSEGMSINHLLAMACGLPCISPDNTVMTELIGNDKDENKNRGFLVNNAIDYMLSDLSKRFLVDTNDLMEKMKKIYTDKELRLKLGNNAEKWSKQYTWDRIVKSWHQSLLELN